jgi:hypothetical protein
MRLNALDEVDRYISDLRASLVVLKPLVESQRAPELLADLSRARAVWMYRHYRDVATSSVRTFGGDNAIQDLELLLTNEPPNWRGEVVPDETRNTVEELFAREMNPLDAAALFWWARNMLFLQLGLSEREDVRLLSYETLVKRTVNAMRGIYDFLGFPFVEERFGRSVHERALDRGREVSLSPRVERLCLGLYERLDASLAGESQSTL